LQRAFCSTQYRFTKQLFAQQQARKATQDFRTNQANLTMDVEEPTITLTSIDGDTYRVRKSVAKMSELVKTMMDEDDDDAGQEIPLPNVKSQVLVKVLEFCEHHLVDPMTEIEKPLKSNDMKDVVQRWYADFVNIEQVLLFELILAANFMDIKPLLDLTCATVASMIKGKTPEDIRSTFNITNDFSPEEEAQVREENKWCEEA
jgi:S-phase kinase-associated protein 1